MPSILGSKAVRHRESLADEIAATGSLRSQPKKRKSTTTSETDGYVDSRASRKILKISKDLVAEEESERNIAPELSSRFAFESRQAGSEDEAEDDDEEAPETWRDEEEAEIEVEDMNPEDLELFNKFNQAEAPALSQAVSNEGAGEGCNLADLILEKIAAHEAAQTDQDQPSKARYHDVSDDAVALNPKIVQVYSTIGLLLSRYKSGKLPKPFKIIPTLPQWEDLLALTKPEEWTPNACYEATKIFVSSKPHIIQSFLENVILDRVKEDIYETKKLNVHLFKALKKALYKPAAFFKGFLFPLVGDGTCTLREAHIVSSVLIRVSIPVLHSAAALLRLTEIAAEQTSISTESAGATNIFIRVLLEKKYALPYKVIDGLVFHFLRFRATPAGQVSDDAALGSMDLKLPVLWHQCLLAFAQRYRNDITEDQREALLDLLLIRGHKDIGPEVRRELLEGMSLI